MSEPDLPDLPESFTSPPGTTVGHFKNPAGADVRFAHVPAKGESRGTVVLLQGFRESLEKYHEAARDFQERGFDVWLMDWRGQGGSERYLKDTPMRAHHEGYDEQVATLDFFMRHVVRSGQPMLLCAHSMGAHISLRYMAAHPGVFSGAMLSAPMVDIATPGLARPLARQMVKFAKAGNHLDRYVPGGGDFSLDKMVFDGNNKTSDRRRFDVWKKILADNPSLQVGDATYGWVLHTFKSIEALGQDETLKSITTPVLMQVTDGDKVVLREAQDRAAKLIPDCTVLDIPACGHEVWMERDELRNCWLAALDDFIEQRVFLKKPAAAKKKNCAPRP